MKCLFFFNELYLHVHRFPNSFHQVYVQFVILPITLQNLHFCLNNTDNVYVLIVYKRNCNNHTTKWTNKIIHLRSMLPADVLTIFKIFNEIYQFIKFGTYKVFSPVGSVVQAGSLYLQADIQHTRYSKFLLIL